MIFSLPGSDALVLPGVLQDRYELAEELPALGRCRRLLTTRRRQSRQVALVELISADGVTVVSEGLRGAQALAGKAQSLVHPHLARLVEFGVAAGEYWAVGEATGHHPLASYLRECPTLAGKLRVAIDLWEALAYVHARGLVHGCVCPGNLWHGPSGGVIGGLGGSSALAQTIGREEILGTEPGLPSGTAAHHRPPTQQDVHDLGQALLWLTEWPETIGKVLAQAQGGELSAGQTAVALTAAGREHLGEAAMPATQKGTRTTAPVPPGVARPRVPGSGLGAAVGAFGRGLVGTAVTFCVLLALFSLGLLALLGPAPEVRTVPNVTGMSVADAQRRMEASQLSFRVISTDYSPQVAEGAVIRTQPYGGKLVRAGRDVLATVSRGRREAKVPDLKGLSIAAATEKLEVLNLACGTVQRQADPAEVDTVLSQEPQAGKVLPRDGKVNLVASGGPEFGTLKLAGGDTYVFRSVHVRVPRGKALQLVTVTVHGGEFERSFQDRLCRPGETLDVDVYGPSGARVRVEIDDERVFSERL